MWGALNENMRILWTTYPTAKLYESNDYEIDVNKSIAANHKKYSLLTNLQFMNNFINDPVADDSEVVLGISTVKVVVDVK